jgi:hypothetical protein
LQSFKPQENELKKLLFIIALVLAVPTIANAKFLSAESYFNACDNASDEQMGFCTNYIAGVYEGLVVGTTFTTNKETGSDFDLSPELLGICANGQPNTMTLHTALMKYIIDHPEQSSWPVSLLAKDVFSSTYPCKK